MKFFQKLGFSSFWLSLLLLTACEREFTPEVVGINDNIVVEGYIEAGDRANPPFVILTRSVPFFSEFSTSSSNIFVRDAQVWVSNGTDSVRLVQFCWADLDSNLRRQAARGFGINIDSVTSNFNFCAYGDITGRMRGEVGKSYQLTIVADNRRLTANTTIPNLVRIDSANFVRPPGNNKNDSMLQMRPWTKDPAGIKNYYRSLVAVNGSSYGSGRGSVTDDALFDGINTQFYMPNRSPNRRRSPEGESNSIDALFFKGDTISIKYCQIDKAHFDFWRTLEFNSNNQGPFSSYTRVQYNIKGEGGIGIWGGIGVTYYETVAPK